MKSLIYCMFKKLVKHFLNVIKAFGMFLFQFFHTSKNKSWKYLLSNPIFVFCFVCANQLCVTLLSKWNRIFCLCCGSCWSKLGISLSFFRVWACSLIWWSTARGTDTVWWSCRWREVKSGTPCACLTKMSCRLRDLSAPSLLWWRYINTQTQRKTTAAWLHFTLTENRT